MKEATPALEAGRVFYRYGRYAALENVNLLLPANRIYGLLGKNGAGKTTLMNLISAAIPPKRGEVKIFGQRPFENASALQKLCFVRERNMYPAGARVGHILCAAKAAFPRWDGEYARRLTEKFGLDIKKRYKQLSRGMESSLGLVIGLASRAPLTMFDEPSLGLDASAREIFYEEVRRDFLDHPRALVISTHLIDEGAELFDDAIIMDQGRVLLHENVKEMLAHHAILVGEEEILAQSKGCRTIHRGVTPDGKPMKAVRMGAGFDPGGAEVREISLQKLFVYLTEGGEG